MKYGTEKLYVDLPKKWDLQLEENLLNFNIKEYPTYETRPSQENDHKYAVLEIP